MSKKTELIPRWCGELAHYFSDDETKPENIELIPIIYVLVFLFEMLYRQIWEVNIH